MECFTTECKTIGEIVAADYRTAKVFETYGVDYYCGGDVDFKTMCTEQGLDLAMINAELDAVKYAATGRSQNYSSWALPFLADYIVNTHHLYLKEKDEQIAANAKMFTNTHGTHHHEMIQITESFAKIASEILVHQQEEEDVLFPAIKRIDAARIAGTTPDVQDRETIQVSVQKLHLEHKEFVDAVHVIRKLSKNFLIRYLLKDVFIPADVCTAFISTYQKIKEFENDLHKHIHLENNILFPKAAEM